MCSAFPLSPLITYSLLSYRYSRLSASAEEADTDEFHSTSIFAMDARRLGNIFTLILSNIGISVMLMYLKILKQKMTKLYISRSIIENLSIYFHFRSPPRIIQSFPGRWSYFLPNCQGRQIWWSEGWQAQPDGRLFPLCCRAGIQQSEVLSSCIDDSCLKKNSV